MRSIFVAFSILIATTVFNVLEVHACSCMERQTPAKAYSDASVVWVGTAESVLMDNSRSGLRDLKVTFQVKEFLKGKKSDQAVLFTSSQGTACGMFFNEGETYLVYGYLDSERNDVTTGRCTRTRQIDLGHTDDELEILRSLRKGRFEPRLYGRVEEITRGIYLGDQKPNRPQSRIPVIARGQGNTYKTTTDADGHFRFVGIRPGRYVLDLDLPPTHKIGDDSWGFKEKQRPDLSFTVSVDDTPDFITIQTRVNGKIAGRVLDSNGQSVGKGVRITLVTTASADKRVEEIQYIGIYTDSKGFYEFDGIPEGEYLLGVNLDMSQPYKDNPYPKVFYPSAKVPSSATVIKLGYGQKLKGYDLTLPAALRSVPFRGRVLYEDGSPVRDLTVYVTNQARHDFEDFEWLKTDVKGEFTASCLDGLSYRVSLYDGKQFNRVLATRNIVVKPQDNEPLEFRISR